MHDSLRVCVAERVEYVAEDSCCFRDWKLACAAKPGAKVLARHERHRIVENPSACPRDEERNYVRVLESGCELDLAPETFDAETR
jgi:hypothetical protein